MTNVSASIPDLVHHSCVSRPPPGNPHRIVIVGGGAAGLALATILGNRFGRSGGRASVTLIERTRTHLWKPLLHEVAAGSLNPSAHEIEHIGHAYRHKYDYRYGTMVHLDRDRRLVKLTAAVDEHGRDIMPGTDVPYDTLVIAIGSVSNDFGTPGAAEFAIPLETPGHARRFHRRLVDACVRANSQEGPVKPGQLHIAVIGAGATGTELAAGLHRTARALVANGLNGVNAETDIRIMLIEAAPRILPLMPDRTSRAAQTLLEKQGIEVHTNIKVAEVRRDGVVLADGTFIASELVVWAAGVKGPEVLSRLDGLEATPRNQLVVNGDLSTSRDPDIFALGDCAAAPRLTTTGLVPPRAQAAHQMASHFAHQMARRLDHHALAPFKYRDYGALVSLGRHTTVGNLKGPGSERSIFVKGLFARLMYISLYKFHEMSLHGIGRVTLNMLSRSLSRTRVSQVTP